MGPIRRAVASLGRGLLNMATNNGKRETLSLNDRRLLEMLGLDPDEISVRGRRGLREATVYACVKILSESIAKLPVQVHQDDERGKRKAVDHHLYQLLKTRPNPFMTTAHVFGSLEAQRNLYGNAVAWMDVGRDGRVQAIWPLDMETVQIVVDDVGILGQPGRVWYVVSAGGEPAKLRSDSVLHFRTFSIDGLVGISPLDQLKGLIEVGAAGTQYLNRFFKQGLTARGIVQYTGDLDQARQERFRERFERMASGLRNAHRIVPMPMGFQYQPLSHTLADAQFLENSEMTIRQIATSFGIKMHQLNDLSRATHTNVEEQDKQFYRDTMQAILTAYEQELSYKLFLNSEVERGYYVRFNVDSMVRSDIKTRYEAYRIGIHGGFIAPNEARAWEDMPPMQGGEEPMVSRGMVPLSKLESVNNSNSKGGGASLAS